MIGLRAMPLAGLEQNQCATTVRGSEGGLITGLRPDSGKSEMLRIELRNFRHVLHVKRELGDGWMRHDYLSHGLRGLTQICGVG